MQETEGIVDYVLDWGYVRLVDHMGSDLSPVNAARVSYDRRSEQMTDSDKSLVKFLAENGHSSPFRHATLQFEIYAPLMVARQWWKYVVGSDHTMEAWNESSRRYITEEPEFFNPLFWRDTAGKQATGAVREDSRDWSVKLAEHIYNSKDLYEEAMAAGVTAEQARLFLPAYSMYVRWYWTASLQAVAHFLNQRLKDDAQAEIREYAGAVYKLAAAKFPVSIEQLVGEKQ